MKPQASALSEDEYDLVQGEVFQTLLQIEEDQECVADGLTPISLAEVESIDPGAPHENDPHLVLRAIRNLIDGIRSHEIESIDNEEVEAFRIGHTIAYFAARYLGWELEFLKSDHIPDGEVAVTSPDKTYALYPALYVYKLFVHPGDENTSLLTFNMLKKGEYSLSDGPYSVVLG